MIVKMREKQIERDSLDELLEFTGLSGITMIEVGSYAGESAEQFASSGKVKTLWCVDPWKSGYAEKDVAAQSDFAEVESKFDKVVERHPTIIHKFKGTLSDFIGHYPEIEPDVIYIDACHTYDACRSDIMNALKYSPRFMAGHDYCDGWSGVKKAVNESFGRPDRVFEDSSWIINMADWMVKKHDVA